MSENINYFFVDESGDPTFYNKKKKLMLEKEGCSPVLILGFVKTENPYNTSINTNSTICIQTAGHETCLQIIDYMNWAIYRAFTKGEMRFLNKVKDKISLLIDIYDFDKYPKSYYNKNNPFDISKITPLD